MMASTIAIEFRLAAERHKYVCEKILSLSEFDSIKSTNESQNAIQPTNSQVWQLLADTY